MTTALLDKTSRMDLRLTRLQRENYEQAASLKGQTLSQWSTQHLDECARRDIDEARITALDAESFEAFCRMLEAPVPDAMRDLLERKEDWA